MIVMNIVKESSGITPLCQGYTKYLKNKMNEMFYEGK